MLIHGMKNRLFAGSKGSLLQDSVGNVTFLYKGKLFFVMREPHIKDELSEIESVVGRGTSLISLYIPHDKDIVSERRRINQEKNEARNIRSDSNRKRVINTLT